MKRDGFIEAKLLIALLQADHWHMQWDSIKVQGPDGATVPGFTVLGHLHLLADQGLTSETKEGWFRLTVDGQKAAAVFDTGPADY